MHMAQSGGATVVWVGMPPMQSPALNAEMADINARGPAAGRQRPATGDLHQHAQVARARAQGGYTAFVTNAAGQVVNVRTPDGIHLTPGGGQVVAQQVIDRAAGPRLPRSPRPSPPRRTAQTSGQG